MDAFFFEYRDFFSKRVKQMEADCIGKVDPHDEETVIDQQEISVCVRIRPLNETERDAQHVAGVIGHRNGAVNLYEPRRKINKKPDLNNSTFTLDQIYLPKQSTEDIYNERVQDLVRWSLQGGTSMLLAYGQTGSGKTFTVTGLERLLVNELMDGQASGKKEIRVCIFEVAGSSMFDLLQDRNPLTVREDTFGTMQLGGILEKNPHTSSEFLDLIDTAKALRSTATTAKNDQSSRSHSICRIRIVDTESEIADEGCIMLVDLAGSEASADSSHHSKERMAETVEINKSLNILKECITKRAQWSISKAQSTSKQHVHIPFRTNKLTQVLKSAFDVHSTRTCKTIVIACIAPSILDVAQSKNTLRYAETLRIPIPKAKPMAYHELIPTTWSASDVERWIQKNSGNPPINPALLAPNLTGEKLCRMEEEEFVRRALLTEGVGDKQAKALYFKLWSLHIDSRALLSRPGGSVGKLEAASKAQNRPGTKVKTAKTTIKPGMFFRLRERDTEGRLEFVMAMGETEGGRWTCAAVSKGEDDSDGYELSVTKQVVLSKAALADEIALVYDRQTRYYVLKDRDTA